MDNPDFVFKVLRLFDQHDSEDDLCWRCGEEKSIKFFINCNDLFWWGVADGEEITPENFDDIEVALKDVITADPNLSSYEAFDCALVLWCCRVRKMRPQGACYSEKEKLLWPLYDAAGPEREVAFGNPYKPGERDALKRSK